MVLLVAVDEAKLGNELPIENIVSSGGDVGRMAH